VKAKTSFHYLKKIYHSINNPGPFQTPEFAMRSSLANQTRPRHMQAHQMQLNHTRRQAHRLDLGLTGLIVITSQAGPHAGNKHKPDSLIRCGHVPSDCEDRTGPNAAHLGKLILDLSPGTRVARPPVDSSRRHPATKAMQILSSGEEEKNEEKL
jgi:hypothetical protein